MAAGGQFHAEFGSDDARAAVGGIASDADAHRAAFESPSHQWEPLRYNNWTAKRPCLRATKPDARVART
jgi:hypothetical protein